MATAGIAVLALGGAALADIETTGALYTAESVATLEGFQVQSLCDFESYDSVQDLLADLEPSLWWGFAVDEDPVPWTAVGDPAPTAAEPDGTLVCDDGVLSLAAGQAIHASPTFPAPATAILVLATPTTDGSLLTITDDDGPSHAVVVEDSTASLLTWDAGAPPVQVASVDLDDDESAHVIAVVLDGTDVTLWVDGTSDSGTLPAAVSGPNFGLGAVPGAEPDGEIPETATFTATELALVPGIATSAQLDDLLAAATAP